MSQHDFDIADQLTPAFRADLNLALVALAENSSGATAPSTTYAGMNWLDTSGTNTIWKRRSAADDAWTTIGVFDETNNLFIPDFNGLTFAAGDILYHDGTDFARLAKGTSGQFLRQNSALTAPEWASYFEGFTWQNVTSSRADSTNYQNNTGDIIFVSIIGISTTTSVRLIEVSTDASTWIAVGATGASGFGRSSEVFPVPDGSYYRVNGATSSLTWSEFKA